MLIGRSLKCPWLTSHHHYDYKKSATKEATLALECVTAPADSKHTPGLRRGAKLGEPQNGFHSIFIGCCLLEVISYQYSTVLWDLKKGAI